MEGSSITVYLRSSLWVLGSICLGHLPSTTMSARKLSIHLLWTLSRNFSAPSPKKILCLYSMARSSRNSTSGAVVSSTLTIFLSISHKSWKIHTSTSIPSLTSDIHKHSSGGTLTLPPKSPPTNSFSSNSSSTMRKIIGGRSRSYPETA